MLRRSARTPVTVQRGAVSAPARKPDSRVLTWFVGLAIWVQVFFVTVNFANFNPGASMIELMAPNPATRFLKVSLIATGLLFISLRWHRARDLLRSVNRYFLVFLALAICSVLWSIDPGATVARLVGLGSTTILALAFCLVGWDRCRFQKLLRASCTALLLGSLIFGILYPMLAIDQDAQAGWHGLASQKNPFGELAAFGALFWMHGAIAGEVKWWKALLGTSLGVVCLVLSKSSTSMLATAFAVLFMVMTLRMPPGIQRYSRYCVIAFATIILVYAMAVLKIVPGLDTILLDPITALTGKDMTFSNRSVIWDIIKEHAWHHPLLGTGYGAYWTAPVPSSPSYVFLGRMYFWPSESHNGYLEVFNDLGFVGLACLLGYLVAYLRQSLQLFRLDRTQGTLYLALFFQQATTNLSETLWLASNGVLAVTVVTMATFSISRSLQAFHGTSGQSSGGSWIREVAAGGATRRLQRWGRNLK